MHAHASLKHKFRIALNYFMKKETTTITTTTTATRPRVLTGIVVSDKMKDTVVVEVKRFIQHKKYRKFYSRSKKYHAHDAGNTLKAGDEATIEECRPISKTKRFRVVAHEVKAKTV